MSQVRLDLMGNVSPAEKKVKLLSPLEMYGQVAQFFQQRKKSEGVGGQLLNKQEANT